MSIPCYKTSAQPHPKCAPLPYPLAWVVWDDERAMVARGRRARFGDTHPEADTELTLFAPGLSL